MAQYIANKDSYGPNCKFYKKGQVYELIEPWAKAHFDLAEALPPAEKPREPIVPLSLASATYPELREIAKERGVEVKGNPKKDDLIAQILEAEQLFS